MNSACCDHQLFKGRFNKDRMTAFWPARTLPKSFCQLVSFFLENSSLLGYLLLQFAEARMIVLH